MRALVRASYQAKYSGNPNAPINSLKFAYALFARVHTNTKACGWGVPWRVLVRSSYVMGGG